MMSPPKETREFDGVTYVLERGIRTDFALVHAWKGDRHGNLVYRYAAGNFNPEQPRRKNHDRRGRRARRAR